MRVLLDHCIDRRIIRFLPGHEIRTAREMGWENLKNGELLLAASLEFGVLLTVDRGFSQQHNQATVPIAIVVVVAVNNRLKTLLSVVPNIEEGLSRIASRQLVEIRSQE